MTGSSDNVARRYFEALDAHDLDAAVACWRPGGVDRLVGTQDLVAPEGIRTYFSELFAAFPDFSFEILQELVDGPHTTIRWRARATFAGPGRFQGIAPNGARMEVEGCDVVTATDRLIDHLDAYMDSGEIARQLGLLPRLDSKAQARLTTLANARIKAQNFIHGSAPERIADGVWIVRGGFPQRTMNVFLIEDDGGLTLFDAGISSMTAALASCAARLGPIKRIVLSHADADHRGAAPGLDAPVYCHPADREAAESPETFRPYWDLSKLGPHGRLLLGRLLPMWDGGAVEIEGTVQEGDQVAGFEVIDLPGHAPGLVGLYRESDRIALVSDLIYMLDPQTQIKGRARLPHPAFDIDTEQARASIRKLAAMSPSVVWSGHADPVQGDVGAQLESAASAPV